MNDVLVFSVLPITRQGLVRKIGADFLSWFKKKWMRYGESTIQK